jgi:hypothetical protein
VARRGRRGAGEHQAVPLRQCAPRRRVRRSLPLLGHSVAGPARGRVGFRERVPAVTAEPGVAAADRWWPGSRRAGGRHQADGEALWQVTGNDEYAEFDRGHALRSTPASPRLPMPRWPGSGGATGRCFPAATGPRWRTFSPGCRTPRPRRRPPPPVSPRGTPRRPATSSWRALTPPSTRPNVPAGRARSSPKPFRWRPVHRPPHRTRSDTHRFPDGHSDPDAPLFDERTEGFRAGLESRRVPRNRFVRRSPLS